MESICLMYCCERLSIIYMIPKSRCSITCCARIIRRSIKKMQVLDGAGLREAQRVAHQPPRAHRKECQNANDLARSGRLHGRVGRRLAVVCSRDRARHGCPRVDCAIGNVKVKPILSVACLTPICPLCRWMISAAVCKLEPTFGICYLGLGTQ